MKKLLKITAIILLIFTGISALAGGYGLIMDPSGKAVNIPLEYLRQTPFPDYLLPGIILFMAIGILSLIVAFTALRSFKNYPYFIILQGCILAGWILIQMMLIQTLHALHVVYGSVGIVLIIMGFMLRVQQREMQNAATV